ncbi:hypothetical protein TWF481_002204 [Arthrobotrys musiformis]|uniref:Uncharacterized protein n=1 Tax=Arthrobotrys musiformis TaxID=47236 RepID=A0AAV9VYL4_9PEZI
MASPSPIPKHNNNKKKMMPQKISQKRIPPSGISNKKCFGNERVWFMSFSNITVAYFSSGIWFIIDLSRFDLQGNPPPVQPVIVESGSDMTGLWQDLSGRAIISYTLFLIFLGLAEGY